MAAMHTTLESPSGTKDALPVQPTIEGSSLKPESPARYASSRPRSASSTPPVDDIGTTANRGDGRRVSRRRSIEVVAEAKGDVQGFMEELEEKRRQLDDQIHRYIGQKEREFKLYERDLRTKYRTTSRSDNAAADAINHSSSSPTTKSKQNEGTESDHFEDVSQIPSTQQADDQDLASTLPLSKSSTVRPTESVAEREKDLLGLFTPPYLLMLDGKSTLAERSESAPPAATRSQEEDHRKRDLLTRANTDSIVETSNSKRPVRLRFSERTLSAGSESGKGLVSALKSPRGGPGLPKRKRVSLVVGDEVVAPSDNVSADASPMSEELAESTQASPEPDSVKENEAEAPSEMQDTFVPMAASNFDSLPLPSTSARDQGGIAASLAAQPSYTAPTTPKSEEPDLLDSASPFAMDEDFDDLDSPELYEDDDSLEEETYSLSSSPTVAQTSPSGGVTIRRAEAPISNVQLSSSASAQPVSAGFSRPSVRTDPHFVFDEDQEDPAEPGSMAFSFSRPGAMSQQSAAGSLGESFMARNAELMMRRRMSLSKT